MAPFKITISSTYTRVLYVTILFAAICVANSDKTIDLNGKSSLTLKAKVPMLRHGPKYGRSVSRFARHDLCRHRDGQLYFYNIVKSKICDIDDMFVEAFVTELCEKKGKLLELWAGKLFDSDGDGLITDLERTFYDYENV